MFDLNDEPPTTNDLAKIKLPRRMGNNPIAYAERAYTPNSCLLGNRYLTRKSGMFFIGPSGQGKSTAIMQSLICWACGRTAFEIKPAAPLRILLVQAEDDDDDLTDMARVADHLELSTLEKQLVQQNAWIETVNDQLGFSATAIIREILAAHPCDLLILNPYTGYLEGSIQDDDINSKFLRTDLQRIATEHNCGLMIVHHTPKTNFRQNTGKWSTMDWMYSGAGAAVLTNWARAILAIDPIGESGVFKFIAAKRGQKIGWSEKVNHFRHDPRPGVLLWTKADHDEIALAANAKGGRAISSADVCEAVPLVDGIRKMALREKLQKAGASQRVAKEAVEIAIDEGFITEIKTRGDGHTSNIKMIYRSENAPVLFTANGQT